MGVTLARAWEICRYLDELDAERCASDSRRAVAMTSPRVTDEGNDAWKKLDA